MLSALWLLPALLIIGMPAALQHMQHHISASDAPVAD